MATIAKKRTATKASTRTKSAAKLNKAAKLDSGTKLHKPKRSGMRPKLIVDLAEVDAPKLRSHLPRLNVSIEPMENGKGVYLPLAPTKAGGQRMVKLVLRLRLVNVGTS